MGERGPRRKTGRSVVWSAILPSIACSWVLDLPEDRPCERDADCPYREGPGQCRDGWCVPPGVARSEGSSGSGTAGETEAADDLADASSEDRGGDDSVTSTTGEASTATGATDTGGSADTTSGECGMDAGTSGDVCAPPTLERPIGWAAVGVDGLETGVTGGEGGETVRVATVAEFEAAADDDEPRIIVVDGTLVGVPRLIGSNKTIEGAPGASILGGLELAGTEQRFVQNVIVRDLALVGNNCVGGCGDVDALSVRRASHVWIDHCDISDGDDGNLDITRESDFVTVSWTRFSYSDPDKQDRASNLVGGSDDNVDDAGHLRVTFHHNWWDTNVDRGMPRLRFGRVHLFNNYYTAAGNTECIRVGLEASVRVEANVFEDVQLPIADPVDPTAVVLVAGNLATPDPLTDAAGEAFEPPYPFSLSPLGDVARLVQAETGPRPPDQRP